MMPAGTRQPRKQQKSGREIEKGKAKEQADKFEANQSNLNAPVTQQAHAQIVSSKSQDEWAWSLLADSAVSHRPAVITADGNYFFSISESTVKIYSISTGKVVSTLSSASTGSSGSRVANGEGHTDVITAAILNPENPFQLLTASLDGDIKIWDYLEATLLRTIRVGQPISHMCTHKKHRGQVFVAILTKHVKGSKASTDKGNTMVYRVSLTPTPTSTSHISKSSEIHRIGKTKAAVSMAISASGSWLVVIAGYKAYVTLLSSPESGFTKFVSPERLTCLALHPIEDFFATGDERGQLRLWYCLNQHLVTNSSSVGEKRAQTTTMHWHAHAVSAISFTPNGAYLLSGGEESVLVIWQLHTGKKEFVPRLGAPILSMAVREARDSEEDYILGLVDGTYLIVGSGSLSVTRSIPRMKLDPKGMARPAHSPVPLAIHPKDSTIILPASHPSSLQIYSLESSSLVSELEVSSSNRVSRLDEKPLEASRVDFAVVDSKGEWMATLDRRENDEDISAETYLKLWHWESSAWVLNTRLDHPHGFHAVNSVSFCPHGETDLLMTTGTDGNLKLWCTRSLTTKDGKTEVMWVSRSIMSFRSEIPLEAKWSPDGSVFAVCTQRQVALYATSSSVLMGCFTTSEVRKAESLNFLGSSGRFLLVHGKNHAILWDLINRSVRWHYHSTVEITHVLAHPKDDIVLMIVQPYVQEGAARISQVLHFSTESSQPRLSKSLPFRFRAVDWNRIEEGNCSFIGITSTWNIVVCGDDTAINDSVTSPEPIKGLVQAESRKTLFRDIFGESAFEPVEPVIDPRRVQSTFKEGKGLLVAIDVPSYSAPPIDSVFSSLMDGFLIQHNKSLKVISEDVKDIDQEEDLKEDTMDIDVPSSIPQIRTVDDRELEELISIFRKQSISNRPKPKINGLTNGIHKPKSNGIRISEPHDSPHHPHVNGVIDISMQKDSSLPTAKTVEPSSPSAVGKKRKKSTV